MVKDLSRFSALILAEDDSDLDEACVSLSIPLLIRLMEYAREDAKTDMDLHFVAEKVTSLGDDGPVTMKNYADIVKK